jgi:hypothetical protein
VKRIGIAAYIEQQLNPESIVDEGVEQRLAGFETQDEAQQLLAAYRRRNSCARSTAASARARDGSEAMSRRFRSCNACASASNASRPPNNKNGNEAPEERRARRRAGSARAAQAEAMNGPQRIVLELSQAKILRAAYSERQLQK